MDYTSRTLNRARSADGTPIAYEQRGDGPAVVLVSGALDTAAAQAPLADLLASHFSVFTYDRRGRGGSGDTAGYAVEREVEDLAAVIEEAGGRARVHGSSSGGALALRAAASGLPITQLSVYEPPFDPATPPGCPVGDHLARTRELVADGKVDEALVLFLDLVGTPGNVIEHMRDFPVWSELAATAHTLPYDYAVMGDGAVPVGLLHEVAVRVMVIEGGASAPSMREAARLVAEALPRGRHRTLTGQTHDVAPHVLAPVVATFFAS
ncbi:alpha/beta fold hydrolase [Streptomyces sp. NPDC048057]|uniref:alpha/beta fold hydrolase n=1 Tax=Streptomyces sp. NPDC048057 TaxID=3155628 RepID=UPI0033E8F886